MAGMRRTAQEHVDDVTMRLENRHAMVGSGYVDYGPQVPFKGRIIVQPTTVQADEVPDWFDRSAPQKGGHHHYQSRGPAQQYRGHQQQHNYQPTTGHHQQQRGHAYNPSAHHNQHQGQHRPTYVPLPQSAVHHHPHPPAGPKPAPPPHRPTTPGVFDTTSLMQALQPVAPPVAPQAPVPAQNRAPQSQAESGSEQGDKKLSKSQRAKLRKKLRDGKSA